MLGARTGYAVPETAVGISSVAPAVLAAEVLANPSSYTLGAMSGVVPDQKELPCCVSCALSAAMQIRRPGSPELSPLFHYYVTRYDDMGANTEGFLSLSASLASVSASGICARAQHAPPFTPAGAATRPSPNAYADGRARALGRRGIRRRYAMAAGPSTAAWIRDQLARNYPVVIGFRLPSGYPGGFLDRQFAWLDPAGTRSDDGHCVLAVGYSDARRAVQIQDSRGPQAFDRGRWWMGYRVLDSGVVQEAYSLLP